MAEKHSFTKHMPGVEFRESDVRKIDGYFTLKELVRFLDEYEATVRTWIKKGVIKPDFRTRLGVYFAESRKEEIKQKWADRHRLFQDSEPVQGVITSFGVMVPRVKPKREVLERIALTRPKQRLRHSYSKTRKHYNLKDLLL